MFRQHCHVTPSSLCERVHQGRVRGCPAGFMASKGVTGIAAKITAYSAMLPLSGCIGQRFDFCFSSICDLITECKENGSLTFIMLVTLYFHDACFLAPTGALGISLSVCPSV